MDIVLHTFGSSPIQKFSLEGEPGVKVAGMMCDTYSLVPGSLLVLSACIHSFVLLPEIAIGAPAPNLRIRNL
jgi:hypothetical protein